MAHDEEGVSAPYRPGGALRGPRPVASPIPFVSLRADFAEQETIRIAGIHAAWLWLCAVCEIRRRGGGNFMTLRDLRRLVDFEEIGVKTKTVVADAVAAGLLASTKDGFLIIDTLLRE